MLPGLDDGPATEGDAFALAAAAARAGTTVLVATPHRNGRWQPSAGTIAAAVERLQGRLDEARVALDLRTGAEVALEQAAALDDTALGALRLGGGPWLLLECPYGAAGPELERVVGDLIDRGHRILLAHPERSPALRDRPHASKRSSSGECGARSRPPRSRAAVARLPALEAEAERLTSSVGAAILAGDPLPGEPG